MCVHEWQPIETVPLNEEVWVTDGKIVVREIVLGPYRTGWSFKNRMGWFGLTHWQAQEAEPELPN